MICIKLVISVLRNPHNKHWSIIIFGSSQEELPYLKDSRGQGVEDSSEMLKNCKELKVWQKSYKLCLDIYKITNGFSKEEKYGLTSQIRRAEVSVPSLPQRIMEEKQLLNISGRCI
jgi:hypothetical protein